MSKIFKAKINSKEIITKLNQIYKETSDLNPFLRIIRRRLLNYIDENFETEGVSSGEKWQQRSDKYLKRLIREGKLGSILQYDSHLRQSFTSKITKKTLTIGTAKEYAAIHNFGSGDGTMPKREYMRFTDEQLEDISFDIEYEFLKRVKYASKN